MTDFDLYLNVKKPDIGLYVAQGAGLPDLADKSDWVFDGTFPQRQVPPQVVEDVASNGHAFRNMS